ncbi:MAG TPA: ATP-binding cassette domain-containing protein [Clostridia bacterium]|nr:ATP-binding cassette domain-containing protein [Clostridia bacterium]
MDEVIRVQNLSFAYKQDYEVLKNISLVFDKKSTAIIGQNGAGKTTFVKLLKGLLKPTSGEIYIKGYNTKEVSTAFLSKYIGLVFQNPNDQIFKNTVLEEVMFGPLNILKDKKQAQENAIKALEMVGLQDKMHIHPYDLGLSDRKLVSIASIVSMDPDIIILDEPTIAQDHKGNTIIKNVIKELKEKGKLVITITHDMDFVAEIFERTIVLNEGIILLDGNTREVFSQQEILKKAYLELPHVAQLAKKLGIKQTLLTEQELINFLKHNKLNN